MKAFIWTRVNAMTSNYHASAGVLAVAETVDEARAMAAAYQEVPSEPIQGRLDSLKQEPDLVLDIVGERAKELFVFPDAGCC